jgi:tetratricopeptide (TPR) repeat protein
MTPDFAFAPLLRQLARPIARLAILGLCASLALQHVRAEDAVPARTPPAEAIDHYSRGRAHYQAGRYKEAVVELERALELDPGSPNLVYNLARVYELLGDIDRAIANYERYRTMLPASEAEERERVGSAIARLQGAQQHVQAARPAATERPRPVVVRSERGVADGAFWTLASLSLAALAVGGVAGGLALKTERDTSSFIVGRDGSAEALYDKADRAKQLALISDISLAAGSVGALTSILLYALRTRPIIEPRVAAANGGFTLTLRGEL